MKVRVIQIVIDAVETITKCLIRSLEELVIGG